MLAYKLGLLEYIEKKTGKKPVLLLDDVLSELDSDKQRRLLEIVSSGYQCVITSTDIPPFFQNRGYTEFRIDDGTIRQQGGNL